MERFFDAYCLLSQERTPGVGQEEEEEEDGTEGGREGEGEGSRNSLSIAEIEEVKKKIAELESRIEEAVSEEVENYELAGEVLFLLRIRFTLMLVSIPHLQLILTES